MMGHFAKLMREGYLVTFQKVKKHMLDITQEYRLDGQKGLALVISNLRFNFVERYQAKFGIIYQHISLLKDRDVGTSK